MKARTTIEKNKYQSKLATYNAILACLYLYGHTPTQEMLAKILGMSRGGIPARLKALEKDKAIKKDRAGQIVVLKWDYHDKAEHGFKSLHGMIKSQEITGIKFGNPNIKEATKKALEDHTRRANEFAEKLRPTIESLQREGITTYAGIADALNKSEVKTRQDKLWHGSNVRNLLRRLKKLPRKECNLTLFSS